MSTSTPSPIERLDAETAVAILASHSVGVIGFTFKDRVDLEPIHYVYVDGEIYGRTSPGTKLTVLQHHPWVAFEVDEKKPDGSWRSVVVHGTFQVLGPEGTEYDRLRHAKAVAAIRARFSKALGPADPSPWRDVVFAIHIDAIEGRRLAPALSGNS